MSDMVQMSWRTPFRHADSSSRKATESSVSVGADLPPAPGPPRKARSARRNEPSVLIAIALGGALGASARYGLAQLIHTGAKAFPWATFWTNISGSFALGT